MTVEKFLTSVLVQNRLSGVGGACALIPSRSTKGTFIHLSEKKKIQEQGWYRDGEISQYFWPFCF